MTLSGRFSPPSISDILEATPELETLQLLRLCRPQEILERLAEMDDGRRLVPELAKFTFRDISCLSAPTALDKFLTERSSQLSKVRVGLWQSTNNYAEGFTRLRNISSQCGFELVLEGVEQNMGVEPGFFSFA